MRSRQCSPARSGATQALLELSEVMGIETDLHRFEQPQAEGARLEEALRDRWVATRATTDASEPARPG
jgi:hypothetical protein